MFYKYAVDVKEMINEINEKGVKHLPDDAYCRWSDITLNLLHQPYSIR